MLNMPSVKNRTFVQKLRALDKVEFRIATEKATGRQRAIDIVLVERPPEKPVHVCDLTHESSFVFQYLYVDLAVSICLLLLAKGLCMCFAR